MRKISVLLLGLTIVFVSPIAANAAFPKKLEGTYHFVGGKKERSKVKQTISSLAKKAPFFYRSKVRTELKKVLRVPKRIVIRMGKGGFLLIKAKRKARCKLDGTPIRIKTPRGEMMLLRRSFKKNKITEKVGMKGKRSRRVHVYRFLKKGKVRYLKLYVKTYVARLKTEVDYVLTFRQK